MRVTPPNRRNVFSHQPRANVPTALVCIRSSSMRRYRLLFSKRLSFASRSHASVFTTSAFDVDSRYKLQTEWIIHSFTHSTERRASAGFLIIVSPFQHLGFRCRWFAKFIRTIRREEEEDPISCRCLVDVMDPCCSMIRRQASNMVVVTTRTRALESNESSGIVYRSIWSAVCRSPSFSDVRGRVLLSY